ncbi:SulP family inorganic anion transporter [Monashia sp. NPDC004114]
MRRGGRRRAGRPTRRRSRTGPGARPGRHGSLVFGAIAIALVALAHAAGIAAAVANPDGSRPDASTDFRAQGLANIAGGLFSALPTGARSPARAWGRAPAPAPAGPASSPASGWR